VPGFVFRLFAPRPTFQSDMSAEERSMMMEHVAYWTALVDEGKVVAFGPVADPTYPYGIGIIVAADLAEAEALRDADPAVRSPYGFRSEIAPMPALVTAAGRDTAQPA
jgi:uncharacterized protein YciI